jgi:hypothetical protein
MRVHDKYSDFMREILDQYFDNKHLNALYFTSVLHIIQGFSPAKKQAPFYNGMGNIKLHPFATMPGATLPVTPQQTAYFNSHVFLSKFLVM